MATIDLQVILNGIPLLLTIAVAVMLIVIVAMAVDCCFGWHKAKERGEARTSYLFSRSLNKFMLYEGLLIICTLIDLLIHFGWYQFSQDTFYCVPITACFAGVILCCVEVWSMREKADEKTRKHMGEVVEIATKVGIAAAQSANREAIIRAVSEALASNHPPENQDSEFSS